MSKLIVLSAGHGYNTPGKRCLNGTREWFLNDRIMDLVENDLRENYDCRVLRADDTTGKKDISLSARVKVANENGADFCLEMHHNAGIDGRADVGGLVIYYAANNEERKSMAVALYNAIQSRTKAPVHPRRAKIVFKEFYVIRKTTCPALLVENGFMDSTTDLPIILSEEHARKTAEGVVAFLVEQLSLEPKTLVKTENTKDNDVFYPAYTGAKTTLVDAMERVSIDYSYKFRKEIAKANNIQFYAGTAAQNVKMYNLLVAGMLVRP